MLVFNTHLAKAGEAFAYFVCLRQIPFNIRKMSSFEVEKEILVKIMDNYQARLFDSEIVFLQSVHNNPTIHLVNCKMSVK